MLDSAENVYQLCHCKYGQRVAAQQSVQADGLQAALFGESNTITLVRGDKVLHIRRRWLRKPLGRPFARKKGI